MIKSVFHIKKMDCPSEISQIEMVFSVIKDIQGIDFDLEARQVTFFHTNPTKEISVNLEKMGLPGALVTTEEISQIPIKSKSPSLERKTLKTLLLINFGMFLFEIVFGLLSESTGLIADSLDMLADSLVYAISLAATGKALSSKRKAALTSGIFQILLAFGCILEVFRKLVYGSEPASLTMIAVSVLALVANVGCLALLHKHKDDGVHMKASWIFSANDVIANIGVILAGILVFATGSRYPDLVAGLLISIIVLWGGIRIIKLAKGMQIESNK